MRILSNDYRSNLPGSTSVAHGGPANFARPFSAYVTSKGHSWVGLVQNGHEETFTKIAEVSSSKGRTYFACFLPQSRYLPALSARKAVDPRVWFAEEIGAIRAFIRKTRPDMLFLNGYSVYAWLLLEAASLEGLPIVTQHAGIARMEFLQYRHLYSAAGMKMMLRMEQDVVDRATLQIFLNDYSRKTFSKIVAQVPKAQSRIIPLPYAAAYDERVVIGCVARWDRIKNHQGLLALAQEAQKRGLPWIFRSVTNIPATKTQARFKKAYQRSVEVVAPMAKEKLAAFYRDVDVMVLPSHFDVSPTVVMEAAMQGKPTLISKGVGWVSEYEASGLKEWVADFSKPAQTVSRLEKLLGQRPFAKFAKEIRTTHAPADVFASYLRAFSEAKRLCASHNSSPTNTR